jgi:hypothetical protein
MDASIVSMRKKRAAPKKQSPARHSIAIIGLLSSGSKKLLEQ